MATNVGTLIATIGVDTRPLKKGLRDAERQTQNSTKKMLGHWQSMAAGIVATYAIYKTSNLIKETALLAARFETLGIVMKTVGKNAGYSAEQMEKYDLALRKTGISMVESRQSLTRMAMAQLDLTKAEQLGRIAQHAAIIGRINSSEAFERMIYGIQSGHLVVLKTIGINVSFEESYKKVADATDRTTTSFSQNEKALIRQHAVLEYGSRLAGVYEAAMTTAGKKLTSFTRYIDDFKVKMGLAFGPATVILVDAATIAMKEMQEEISKPEAQAALKNLSVQLAKTIVQLGKDLPAAIEKTTNTIAGIQALYNSLPDGVIGAAGVGLIGRILLGSTPAGALVSGIYLISVQVEKLEGKLKILGIAGKEEWQAGMLKAAEDLQRARGILSPPKFYKVTTEPPVPLPTPSGTVPLDDSWMDQFKIHNDLKLKLEEQFNQDYANIVKSRFDLERDKVKELQALYTEAGFEKTKIAEIIGDKMKAISERETEYKREQIELEEERFAAIVEAMEARQAERERILELEEEFNKSYNEMGKTRFDLEREQVDRLQEIYEQAGIDKVKVAQLTADKIAAIERAEFEQKVSGIHQTVSMMTQGFEQISEMGGKHSKTAFVAYKAFKIIEALISTRSAAIKAYDSLVGIPYVGPGLAVGAAAAAVAFGMAQVASISAMQPPSYDKGGITRAEGIYQTGNIDEAHIPLESGGTIPVRFDGKSEGADEQSRTPINIVNVNDPGQLDVYLASSRGQDAILNVLSARGQTVRRLVR